MRSRQSGRLAPLLLCPAQRARAEGPAGPDSLVALPRRSEPAPSADEVREVIKERLEPTSLYRVTFAVQPDAEPTAEEIGWGQ